MAISQLYQEPDQHIRIKKRKWKARKWQVCLFCIGWFALGYWIGLALGGDW